MALPNSNDTSRRGFLRRALAGVAGAAALLSPLGVAYADSTGNTSGLAAHDESALAEIQRAYPAEQMDGYTRIRMDRVWKSGALDVETLKLSYRRDDDPSKDPIFITSYSYEGPEEYGPRTHFNSKEHKDLFDRFLPHLAAESRRPIVYLDVVAMSASRNTAPEAVHLASLINDMSRNELGDGEQRLPIAEGKFVLPYAKVEVNGDLALDFSFNATSQEQSVNEKKRLAAKNLSNVVIGANRIFLTSLDGPVASNN